MYIMYIFIHCNEDWTCWNTRSMLEHPEHVLWFDTVSPGFLAPATQGILALSCASSPGVSERQRICSACSNRVCMLISLIICKFIFTLYFIYVYTIAPELIPKCIQILCLNA